MIGKTKKKEQTLSNFRQKPAMEPATGRTLDD